MWRAAARTRDRWDERARLERDARWTRLLQDPRVKAELEPDDAPWLPDVARQREEAIAACQQEIDAANERLGEIGRILGSNTIWLTRNRIESRECNRNCIAGIAKSMPDSYVLCGRRASPRCRIGPLSLAHASGSKRLAGRPPWRCAAWLGT